MRAMKQTFAILLSATMVFGAMPTYAHAEEAAAETEILETEQLYDAEEEIEVDEETNFSIEIEEKASESEVDMTEEDHLLSSSELLGSGTCGENVTWTLTEDGVLTISGTGAMTSHWKSADVPWYTLRANITAVEIMSGVTSIGRRAFIECNKITKVTIPEGVTTIEDWSFYGCGYLKELTVPQGVTEIGFRAFSDCWSLKTVTINEGLTSIGSLAFYACTDLETIYLPGSLTNIYDSAFYGCWELNDVYYSGTEDDWSKITIDSGNTCLIEASNKHFIDYKCGENLTWSLENNVLTIQGTGEMFDYNEQESPWYAYISEISSIEIQSGATNIGAYAFYWCENAKTVTIPDTVTNIGNAAFTKCLSLKSINIPDSVKSIGENAFSKCETLQEVKLPSDITSISENTFFKCTNLSTVDIPKFVTKIEGYAFCECNNLSTISFPDNLIKISNSAFSNCENLTEITFPNNLEQIGISAFYECKNLIKLTIPTSVTNIGDNAFYNIKYLEIFYAGTSDAWEEIKIGSDALEDVTIHFSEGDVTSRKQLGRMDFPADTWSFCNYTAIPIKLTDEDKNAIISSNTLLKRFYINRLIKKGGYGQCYGFAATSVLVADNFLNPKEISTSERYLYDAEVDDNAEIDKNKSSIGRYYLGQFTPATNKLRSEFSKLNTETKINSLISQTKPFSLGFEWTTWDDQEENEVCHGHTVAAYGIEYGAWIYEKKNYNARILIYDSNYPAERRYFYINTDTNTWNAEGYLANSERDDANIVLITSDVYLLSNIDFSSSDTQITYSTENARQASLSINDIIIEDIGLPYNQNGVYIDVVEGVTPDGQGSDLMTGYAEDANQLAFTATADNVPIDASVLFDGSFMSIESDTYQEAVMNKDGILTLSGIEGEYEVNVTMDETTSGVDQTVVSGGTPGSIAMNVTEEGIQITGENLKNVVVSRGDDEEAEIITIPDNVTSVLASENDDEKLVVFEDTDDDGSFETEIHVTELLYAKKATCKKAGYTGDVVCKICGDIMQQGTTIAKKAHTIVTDPAVKATYSSTGLTKGSHCSVCKTVLTKQTVIPKRSVKKIANSSFRIKNTTSGKIKAKWTPVKNVTGYQIQYAKNSKFKNAKKVNVASAKASAKIISKLTKGKTYYVRIRAYKKYKGSRYYSKWTSTKKVTIKK